MSLTTVLGKVLGRSSREARRLSTLRAVRLVGIERLRVGSLVLAPLFQCQLSIDSVTSRGFQLTLHFSGLPLTL